MYRFTKNNLKPMKNSVFEKRFRGHDVEEQANDWDSSYHLSHMN